MHKLTKHTLQFFPAAQRSQYIHLIKSDLDIMQISDNCIAYFTLSLILNEVPFVAQILMKAHIDCTPDQRVFTLNEYQKRGAQFINSLFLGMQVLFDYKISAIGVNNSHKQWDPVDQSYQEFLDDVKPETIDIKPSKPPKDLLDRLLILSAKVIGDINDLDLKELKSA